MYDRVYTNSIVRRIRRIVQGVWGQYCQTFKHGRNHYSTVLIHPVVPSLNVLQYCPDTPCNTLLICLTILSLYALEYCPYNIYIYIYIYIIRTVLRGLAIPFWYVMHVYVYVCMHACTYVNVWVCIHVEDRHTHRRVGFMWREHILWQEMCSYHRMCSLTIEYVLLL